MNRQYRKALLLLVLSVAASAVYVANRHAAWRRVELQRLFTRRTELVRERDAIRRQNARTTTNLSAAERQLAELPADAPMQTFTHVPEVSAWLARLHKLRQLFTDDPRQRIPQLQLLKDDDWLRVASHVRLDTDEQVRHALADARTAAKDKFQQVVGTALVSYVKQNTGELPATVFALAPFFDAPIDPDILGQYDMVATGKAANVHGPALQEKAPVDADYDSRWATFANGGGSRANAPEAWLPNWNQQSDQARAAYRATNKGANPASLEDLIPYFNPPLDSALATRLIRSTREDP